MQTLLCLTAWLAASAPLDVLAEFALTESRQPGPDVIAWWGSGGTVERTAWLDIQCRRMGLSKPGDYVDWNVEFWMRHYGLDRNVSDYVVRMRRRANPGMEWQ